MCPCADHAAEVAARVGEGRARPAWAPPEGDPAPVWAWRAAAAAVCGSWPDRLAAGEAEEEAARRALVPWALGLHDPLRDGGPAQGRH